MTSIQPTQADVSGPVAKITDYRTLHLKVTEETVRAMEQHRQALGLAHLWEVLEHYAMTHSTR